MNRQEFLGRLNVPPREVSYALRALHVGQSEFIAEISVHFSGLNNIGNTGVGIPEASSCLDCDFTRFTALKAELALLARGASSSESPITMLTAGHLVA